MIVAGRAEVDVMTLALLDASKKCAGGWHVHGIMPECSTSEFPRVCELLDKQRFAAASSSQIVVLTAGIGEDSLTLYVNGLINSGKAVVPSKDGFFNTRDESQEERVQRYGRAGRVTLERLQAALVMFALQDGAP